MRGPGTQYIGVAPKCRGRGVPNRKATHAIHGAWKGRGSLPAWRVRRGMPWRVLIANLRHNAKRGNGAEKMRRNIWTAGVVTDIFRECLFAAVWSREPRFDGHPRHGQSTRRP